MSVLRMLTSSSKDPYGPSRPGPSTKSPNHPTLVLDIPAYGAVFMNPPQDPLTQIDEPDSPRNDIIVHGELVITIPPNLHPRKRIKSIKVGIKSLVKLNLPGRINEEDILFQREIELRENTKCHECWLEGGTSIFDFNIILPANHPPHDWHPNGTLRHYLYAQIEGIPKQHHHGQPGFLSFRSKSGTSNGKGRGASGSKSPVHGSTSPSRKSGRDSPSYSRSRSNSPLPPQQLDTALLDKTLALNLDTRAPAYEDVEAENAGTSVPSVDEDWLKGTYPTERTLMLVYNPSPTGEVNELNLRFNGVAQDLGIWDVKLEANPWTICAILRCHLNFTSLSPLATIYCVRVSLVQTHSILSPRDDPKTTEPVVSKRTFLISEQGRRPPSDNPHPKRDWPAIWRGTEAGGKDHDDLNIDIKGRLPNDDSGRPSTVPGVKTPITVSHELLVEVFFTMYGQDQQGRAMKHPAPGGSRLLKIKRDVIVPSCLIVHQHVDLPSYDDCDQSSFFSKTINVACPLCGVRPSEKICTKCPTGLSPHPRHDHDPKLVGDPSGRCRLCSQATMPSGAGHQNCACGMSIDQVEARMRRGMEDEREERGERPVGFKAQEAERGRRG